MKPTSGGIYRGDVIYSVTGVDKTLTTSMAFKISGMYKEQDSLAYINVGSILARCRFHNLRWDAGRVHIDGIRWEEKTWPRDEFIAFRDHVADLLKVKPSPREEIETMIANCGIAVRNYQRLQARHDCTSDKYADFEGLIAAGHELSASLQKELEALQSPAPEMVTAAR